ncbi:MAG: DNA replication/repair protein RecF [Rhodospirillales bacterium]|nr:DNA replication/repair protein RecF [Rhodospirillales bacterium]MSP80048.1 DNA replication/repair protein RecF [Rhodospirillales bacterium]
MNPASAPPPTLAHPDPAQSREAFFLSHLALTDFRTYPRLKIEISAGPGVIVLTGPNGAGKTNVLEAISFLAPGRGLRGAGLQDPTRWGALAAAPGQRPAWAVAARVRGPAGTSEVGTGLDPDACAPERRLVHVDGAPARVQGRLSETFAVHWLTPDMERLFQDGARARRKFVDRVAVALDSGHAERVRSYDQAARERTRLLTGPPEACDPAWLGSLEARMAETGVALACARIAAAEKLDRACRGARGPFPGARVQMIGALEDWLAEEPALAAEERLARALASARARDAVTGTTGAGPQRSDMAVLHTLKDQPAEQCSTGEQKALLVALILGAAEVLAAARGAWPVLLLDEVAAHLDRIRRQALFAWLLDSGAQVWLAGADLEPFESLGGRAWFYAVAEGAIEPLP